MLRLVSLLTVLLGMLVSAHKSCYQIEVPVGIKVGEVHGVLCAYALAWDDVECAGACSRMRVVHAAECTVVLS